MAADTGAVRVGPVERLPSLSAGKLTRMSTQGPKPDPFEKLGREGVNAVRRDAGLPPPPIDLCSDDEVAGMLEEARNEAATIALWAFREREKVDPSILGIFRRRYLQQVYDEKVAEYDRLGAALERRGAAA